MPDVLFAMRLLLSPALIGAASVVARRWGPAVGGWFAALPLTSGPVVLVLALEHDAAFAAAACVGIVLAVAALAAYALVYSWSSRRLGWRSSALLACVAYMAALVPLGQLPVSLAFAFVFACLSLLVARSLLPHDRERTASSPIPTWDIPLRMIIAAGLVWGLAQLSGVVGPRVSGLLAPFPVAVTIMAVFTHRHDGAAAARQFLRSLVTGLASFAAFFLAAGVLLPLRGIATALVTATVGALATHALLWRFGRIELTARQPLSGVRR